MIVGDIFIWLVIGLFMIIVLSGIVWLLLVFIGGLIDQWKESIAPLLKKKKR